MLFSNTQINVQDQICVVSNQWGTENTQRFIDYATELGYSINKVEGEKSNLSKSSSEFISVDIELRRDDQDLICSLKNYKVNTQGDNSEIKKMYDKLGKLGFYHNDMRWRNILYNESKDQFYLIDFEHTSPEYTDLGIEGIVDKLKTIKKKTKKKSRKKK